MKRECIYPQRVLAPKIPALVGFLRLSRACLNAAPLLESQSLQNVVEKSLHYSHDLLYPLITPQVLMGAGGYGVTPVTLCDPCMTPVTTPLAEPERHQTFYRYSRRRSQNIVRTFKIQIAIL